MEIHIVFKDNSPYPEAVIDAVIKSLNNIAFRDEIYNKDWDENSTDGAYLVNLLELMKNTDLGNILNSVDPEQFFSIHYIGSNTNIYKIYNAILEEEISNLVNINLDYGYMTAVTYFEEIYNGDKDKILEKEKRLKEIIHNYT